MSIDVAQLNHAKDGHVELYSTYQSFERNSHRSSVTDEVYRKVCQVACMRKNGFMLMHDTEHSDI